MQFQRQKYLYFRSEANSLLLHFSMDHGKGVFRNSG